MAATNDKQQTSTSTASARQNAKLEHTRGGKTTRDALDLGVPMAPGSDHEGPEDALSANTRGDYSGRLGETNYRPHTTVRVADAKPGEEQVKVIDQREAAQGGS